jgi:hypothetical protein
MDMLRPLFVSALALAAPAFAQSVNCAFGPAGSAPPSTYGAIGWPGTWNSFSSLPTNVHFNLVGLNGQSIAAQIYNNGGTAILSSPAAGTTGGDAALFGNMFLSYNNPTDLCLWVGPLQGGNYQLIIYAMTPNDPTLLSRVRVDGGTPGPTMVGGSWPGQQAPGITYASFAITVPANGTIAFHSGLAGGNIQSGMNGFQLIRIADCYANCDGSTTQPMLNANDFQCFINAFAAGSSYANCDGSTTPPILNANDFNCFLNKYAAGCP